jgi:hypothetical protein
MVHTSIRSGLLIAATLVLAACASPASREAMTPTVTVAKHHPYSLQVKTSGGAETGGGGSSNISDADLKAAIEAAISQSKLFKTVVQGADGADYELNVAIISLAKPSFGLTFTVEMETAWSLTKVSDRSIAMRKSVKSTGVATPGDAFAAVARLRMAVERAASDNISQGLAAIAELSL